MKALFSAASAYGVTFIWWLIVASYVADPFLVYERFTHAGDIPAIKRIRSWLSLSRAAAFLPFLIFYPHSKHEATQQNWLLHSIGIVALAVSLLPIFLWNWTKDFALELLDTLGIISARAAAVYLGMLLLAISRQSAILNFHGFGYLDLLVFHKAAGWWCVAMSLLHSSAYVAYYLVEGGLQDLWGSCFPIKQCPESDGGDCLNILGVVNFYGVLAMVVVVILAVCSRQQIRRSMYERFYFVHLVTAAMFVFFVGLHDIQTMLLAFAGLAFYSQDKWSAWRSRTYCPAATTEIVCQSPSSNIVLLTWESTVPRDLMPGSRWVYLCVENISTVQWHPVSVIRIHNRMHAIIKGLGDWSCSLCDLATSRIAVRIKTEGPFGMQVWKPGAKKNALLLIAGGVGISPFLDLLCNMPENFWWTKITLVWAVRRHEYVSLSAFVDFKSLSQVAETSVFVTSHDVEVAALQGPVRCTVIASPDYVQMPRLKKPFLYRAMCLSCASICGLAFIAEMFRKHVLYKAFPHKVSSLWSYTFALRVAPVSCTVLLIAFASLGLMLIDRLKSKEQKLVEDDLQIQLTNVDDTDVPFCELNTPRHEYCEHDLQFQPVNTDGLAHGRPQVYFSKLDLHQLMEREAKLGSIEVQVCGPQRMSLSATKAAEALNMQGLKCNLHIHESVM